MRLMMLPAGLIPVIAAAAPPGAGPTAKAPSPCGAKILPLAIGNRWTYEQVPAPISAENQIARIAPLAPKTVVVTVKAIDSASGGDTVVTLEEQSTVDLTKGSAEPQLDERTITTTIRCTATKFEISPDAFWFSGEPGGYSGLKLDSIERSRGTSFQLTNGRFGVPQWREDLLVHWTRVRYAGSDAKAGSGTLELERRFAKQQPEPVQTKVGAYTAEKLALITTGRIALDRAGSVGPPSAPANPHAVTEAAPPNSPPMELPAGWVSTLWVAEGAGIVQTLNSFAHMYQLSAVTLK